MEDGWYDSARFWTHSRHDWDPSWYQKLGWPHVGADEWGRMIVTVGFGWVGYVSWAYRTCWRQCCHVLRQQTYDIEAERWVNHQARLDRGQCPCLNATIWRFHFWRSVRPWAPGWSPQDGASASGAHAAVRPRSPVPRS